MMKRMWMAAISLVGIFIAAYLTLYHYGFIGQLTCSIVHGCEAVQTSRWSRFLGLPVAAWGLGYYLTVFMLTMVGIEDRFAESRPLSITLLVLTGWGAGFSIWLTYLEGVAIRAWCQWCISSAIIAVLLFGVSLLDWRTRRETQSF